MDFVELISRLAAGFGMATALPQLVKIWRTRVTTGVSTRLWQLSIASATAWTFHGFWTDQPALSWTTLVLLLFQLGILALVCHNEHLRTAPTIALPLLGSAAFVVVDLVAGPAIFGATVAALPVLGQVLQLRTMVRASDLHGVSQEYLVLNVAANALWLAYGVLAVEWALRCSSIAQLAVCSVVLGYYAYRRVALVRAVPTVAVRTAA